MDDAGADPTEGPGSRVERLALRRSRRRSTATVAWFTALTLAIGVAAIFAGTRGGGDGSAGTTAPALLPAVDQDGLDGTGATGTTEPPGTTTTSRPRTDVLVDPASFGAPWGGGVDGLLTFRGNPTRSYHGRGPVPSAPKVAWRFPDSAMCAESSEKGETRVWCGTGWTGQPAVFERAGTTWLVFGAYDRNVHFLDALTGERLLADFPTGDIVKGSVTVDPDGFPLVYTGSRDNSFRVLAIDGGEARELWRLNADEVGPTMWNNDWDGSALVLRDHLVEGGENSRFHVARLNRGYGPGGAVTVAPELVFHTAGWDDDLLAAIGDREVSIENSVAVWGDTAYFSNSGGLVQGWDLSSLRTGNGEPARTFRYWVGDDTDATIVVDDEGFLYVGVEYERHTERSQQLGQLLKLDPRADDPLVWSVPVMDGEKSGTWSTPAVVDDLVIWPTYDGTVYGLDRASGAVRWTVDLPAPLMGSPVVVDGTWIQGDCAGVLHGFDVRDTGAAPVERWSVELGGCIESTPAVWKGRIYVGTRAGYVYALAD